MKYRVYQLVLISESVLILCKFEDLVQNKAVCDIFDNRSEKFTKINAENYERHRM